jgi:DGQHR domain-containing protein
LAKKFGQEVMCVRIKAFRIYQKGVPIYVSIIPAKDIVSVMRYDRFGMDNPNGYQRDLQPSRVEKALRFLLKEEGTFPTSVLLNYRSDDLSFKAEVRFYDGCEFGTLELPRNELYVMDGQHRLATLQRAIHEDHAFESYPVIVSIFNFTDPERFDEMRQFYIVNSRQKSVPTDLALKFLTKLYKKYGETEVTIREGARKVFEAQSDEIVLELNRRPESPWYNMIELIGGERSGVIKERPMALSIAENILNQRIFAATSIEEITKNLIIYWSAIKEVYPQAFSDPESYTLQKTPGVYAFHSIFPSVYVKCLNEGGYSKDTVKKILLKLRQPPPPIIDDDWWHTKRGNPLALGTSKKMFKMLANELAKKLAL